MSELREKIKAEFEAIKWVVLLMALNYEIDKKDEDLCGLLGLLSHEPDHTLATFKAHIEGCERPMLPYEYGSIRCDAFAGGIDAFRKKLLKSLEV